MKDMVVTYQVVALEGEGEDSKESWGGRVLREGALNWNLEEHRVFVTPHVGSYGPEDIIGEVKDFFRHGNKIMAEIHWNRPEFRSLNTTIMANNVKAHSEDPNKHFDDVVTQATIREIFLAPYLPWGDGEMDPGFPIISDFSLPQVDIPTKE